MQRCLSVKRNQLEKPGKQWEEISSWPQLFKSIIQVKSQMQHSSILIFVYSFFFFRSSSLVTPTADPPPQTIEPTSGVTTRHSQTTTASWSPVSPHDLSHGLNNSGRSMRPLTTGPID